MNSTSKIRLGADIGGTFTDIALDVRGRIYSTKVLTNYSAPEQAILDGIALVCQQASIAATEIDLIIHGTTLATNALIERRGVRTAFVTTEGFRDVIEMRTENRFAQYELGIQLPTPLIPRQDRFTVAGRMGAQGQELQPLDEAAVQELAKQLATQDFGAIAIGFIHAYANPAHEQRTRALLQKVLGDVPISISSEVSPQMREFERFNTVCANAYVRPQMQSYLLRLQQRLQDMGASCPVYMIHSGGGLVSVQTAAEFPVRLVESGPAGGAIFAADLARRFGLEKVVSYDMGGTTAKICLIDDYAPQTARTFEVARTWRFCKGSGMPISIPVIEMIEIGAGGGSIAWVDGMGRIQTGPESAASEPGPACYQRGGEKPAITDADLLLGKLDADHFAGGKIPLSSAKAETAIARDVGEKLQLTPLAAAFGIAEVVDENMANAARVHAVENGKDIGGSTMIAFGGAAPLHAARLCEKLGMARCLIPQGAGVGSAIGFLKAPFGYEALASTVMPLVQFDADKLNTLLNGLRATADGFVQANHADNGANLRREITAYMRYAGQGWEIPVALPDRKFQASDKEWFVNAFSHVYSTFFGRAVQGLEIECVTFAVKTTLAQPEGERYPLLTQAASDHAAATTRAVFDPATGAMHDNPIISRDALQPGQRVIGPAVIVENETSTVITTAFDAIIQGDGSILLLRKETFQ